MNESGLVVILEEVRSQYSAMQEGIDSLLGVPGRLDNIEGQLEVIKTDLAVVKEVVKDHSRTLKTHDHDIARLKSHTGLD